MTLLERELAKKLADREAVIARVRELHRGSPECAHCAGVKALPVCASKLVDTCDACCEVMPCPTIRALDGDAE